MGSRPDHVPFMVPWLASLRRALGSGLVLLVLGAAGTPAGAGGPGPTVLPHVDDLIDAPRALFGKTRSEVERRLGAPLETRGGQAAGPLAGGRTRPVHDLVYSGLVLRFTEAANLQRVVLTAGTWRLPHGLGIGASRRSVEAALGEPQELTHRRYLYLYSDGYPDTVEFYFREEQVSRVEWTYWAP